MPSERSVNPDFRPPNAEELYNLELQGAQNLVAMVTSSLQAGQMPPRNIFEWAATYIAESLIAIESMVQHGGLTEEEYDEIGGSLERTVASLSALLAMANKHKMFVVVDKIDRILKARVMRLPKDFDYTYGGLLPK